MPEYHAVSGSAAEDLFIELFSDAFGAEKAGYADAASYQNAGYHPGGRNCVEAFDQG